MFSRIGIALVAVVVVAAALVAVAVAARAPAPVHRASVTGEVLLQWTYTEPALQVGQCTETTTYDGSQRIVFRTARPSAVTVRGTPGRVRFVPSTAGRIVGTVAAVGTRTVHRDCPGGTGDVDLFDCAPTRRALRRVSVSFSSVRGAVRLRARNLPASGVQVCAPPPDTADEAAAVLRSAPGRLVERNLFQRARATAQGSVNRRRTLRGEQAGTLQERARWTLTLTRQRGR